MSPGTVLVRAFRPSEFGQDDFCSPLQDMTRQANIERYARMLSEGFRLFEDGRFEPAEEEQGEIAETALAASWPLEHERSSRSPETRCKGRGFC